MIDFEIISRNTEYGKKVIAEFGEDIGLKIIEFLQLNGVGFELPFRTDKLVLGTSPPMEIEFIDGDGSPINLSQDSMHLAPATNYLRVHRFIFKINDQPQLLLKSVKLPELDYALNDLLTVQLTYYCGSNK